MVACKTTITYYVAGASKTDIDVNGDTFTLKNLVENKMGRKFDSAKSYMRDGCHLGAEDIVSAGDVIIESGKVTGGC